MQRTQISLTDEERQMLNAAAARTGRSLSALIRDAVRAHYGAAHSLAGDLDHMRKSFGSWKGRGEDGAGWVEQRRSGRRLQAPRS